MGSITLSIKYAINTGQIFSAQDVRNIFLSGVDTSKISDDTINFYLDSAQKFVESYLGILLNRQIYKETFDFLQDDWIQWGYIRCTYPIQAAVSLEGFLGNKQNVTYPKDWMNVKYTPEGKTYSRNLRIVPSASSVQYNSTSALYIGIFSPQMSWWRSNRNIPNYWLASYITGFPGDIIPADILQAVGMIASIPLMGIASDIYNGSRGLGLGIASKSISLDGLSQSVSSYTNGKTGIFGARMQQYYDQLFGVSGRPGFMDVLRDAYSQIIMSAC